MLMIFLTMLVALIFAGLVLRIYGYFEGETVLLDLLDEWRLSAKPLTRLDQEAASRPARADIIVTLSTIPSRIALMEPTIKSLLRQTVRPARIIINVPDFSRREQTAYLIPAFLKDLKTVSIRRGTDRGPASKYIDTLLEAAPEQKIIVVDDDRIYPPRLVEELAAAADRQPEAAFCMSGWRVPDDLLDRPTTIWRNFWLTPPTQLRGRRLEAPTPIDMLMGYAGYVVRPRHIDLAGLVNFSGAPSEAFFVDDVWLSAHCKAPRFALPTRRFNYQSKLRKRLYDRTALARINKGPGGETRRNNTIVLRHFRGHWLTEKAKGEAALE